METLTLCEEDASDDNMSSMGEMFWLVFVSGSPGLVV